MEESARTGGDSGGGVTSSREGFQLRIHYKTAAGWDVRDRAFSRCPVAIGREESCDVVLRSERVSRRHAEIRRIANSYVLVDLSSRNGVWVNDRRCDELTLRTGERFRIDEWWIEFTLLGAGIDAETTAAGMPSAASEAPDAHAAMQAAPESEPEPATETPGPIRTPVEPPVETGTPLGRAFETDGEAVPTGQQRVFLLDDAESVWYVASGYVELKSVTIENGAERGQRTRLGTVRQGECMFGSIPSAEGRTFIGVGAMNTVLFKMHVARFRDYAGEEVYQEEIVRQVDAWITNLSGALTLNETRPETTRALVAGEKTTLKRDETARPAEGLLWVNVREGDVMFGQMEDDPFAILELARQASGTAMDLGAEGLLRDFWEAMRSKPLIPVSYATWIQSAMAGEGVVLIESKPTSALIATADLWEGLALFHATVLHMETRKESLDTLEEGYRLKSKEENDRKAREQAQQLLAGVLKGPSKRTQAVVLTGDPVLDACVIVGRASGIKIEDHPEIPVSAPYDERIGAIAKASRIRVRIVALRGDWWSRDQGPMLARTEGELRPIALVPDSPTSYSAVDSTTGKTFRVDESFAAGVHPFAYALYPSFPDGEITARKMIRFGAMGLQRDFIMLVAMAIFLGLLGTLTPIFTGRLFDTAIPEAEVPLLVQFCVALFLGAFVSAVFKLTQSIAVLRIQGKMDYKLQAAVWDRLLNLPSTFFRDYSSGDLADRAGGVDQIRTLIAGAGVSSVLGSLSSLFYVGLMFKYSGKLAALAIFLTILFVSFSWGMNYLQLRYQRQKLTVQGRITGLVLQLISGVAKIRVSGAEGHAYSIWVDRFSEQRRLEIRIGRIQNFVQVFNAGFPIAASMAIFFVLLRVMDGAARAGGRPMSIGDFIAFNTAYVAFQTAMQSLSQASLDLLRVVPIFERLKPILITPAEVTGTKKYPGRLRGGIDLSRVSFRYAEDGPLILSDVSLKISPGEFIAFVGPSGCGKSTLMRLLLGFEHPMVGSVYYDGKDLKELDVREVRQQIGVVLQNSRLFPADIYRNIVGTTSLTENDAWEAARRAGLADDIEEMPMGMHTYVSEGGGGLSGGQRQRLLIARALVRRPRILFFDEATSALDNRSQATVTESMEKLQATRVVIAHRLSTIMNADRICYMEGGSIQEMGSYEELMKLRGKFYNLAARQVA